MVTCQDPDTFHRAEGNVSETTVRYIFAMPEQYRVLEAILVLQQATEAGFRRVERDLVDAVVSLKAATEAGFDRVEIRIDGLDTRVGALETRVGSLETHVDQRLTFVEQR
jgi:hypothetical protein